MSYEVPQSFADTALCVLFCKISTSTMINITKITGEIIKFARQTVK